MLSHAFIFARGGSKGLPRKNIKLLDGKPLIEYSINVANKCPSISNVFVSTDDDEIASVAEKSGAVVINRPQKLSSDTASEWLAWQHAISWVEARYGKFDQFVSLPCTSPLRNVSDVEKAIEKKMSSQADACISITPSNRSPFFNMVKKDNSGVITLVNSDHCDVKRRQDAPEVFDITTVVYVLDPIFIIKNTKLFDGVVTSIEIPKERAVDIDDIYDFKFAEVLLKEQV